MRAAVAMGTRKLNREMLLSFGGCGGTLMIVEKDVYKSLSLIVSPREVKENKVSQGS